MAAHQTPRWGLTCAIRQRVCWAVNLIGFLSISEGILLVNLESPTRHQQLPPAAAIRSAIQSRLGQVESIEDRSSESFSLFRVEYADDREAERVSSELTGTMLAGFGLRIRCNYPPQNVVSTSFSGVSISPSVDIADRDRSLG